MIEKRLGERPVDGRQPFESLVILRRTHLVIVFGLARFGQKLLVEVATVGFQIGPD